MQSFLERVYGVVTACDEASAERITLSVQTMQVRLGHPSESLRAI
jgi:hypothetical protein